MSENLIKNEAQIEHLRQKYKKKDQEEAVERALSCIMYNGDADPTTWESIRGMSGLKDIVEVPHYMCHVSGFLR